MKKKLLLSIVAASASFFYLSEVAAMEIFDKARARKNYIETTAEKKACKLIQEILKPITAKSSKEEVYRAQGRIIGLLTPLSKQESELEAIRFLSQATDAIFPDGDKLQFGTDDYEKHFLLKHVPFQGFLDKCKKEIYTLLDTNVTSKNMNDKNIIKETSKKVVETVQACTKNKVDQVWFLNMIKVDLGWKSGKDENQKLQKLFEVKIKIVEDAQAAI